jgi:hypothetical protein
MAMRRPTSVLASLATCVAIVPAGAAAQPTEVGAGPAVVPAAGAETIEATEPPTEPDAAAEAMQALQSPVPAERQEAIRALAESGDAAAVPALAGVLARDPDAEVRRYAVIALANLGGQSPPAVQALQDAARNDPAESVRRSATEALARLGFQPPPPPPPPPPPAVPPTPPPPLVVPPPAEPVPVPAVVEESYLPGHHFGLGVRVLTTGAWSAEYDEPPSPYCDPRWDPCTTHTRRYEGASNASAGFVLFWEYLTSGGIVGIGAGLGVHFHDDGPADYVASMSQNTEFQLDPRLRVFFTDHGWLRPYVQFATGLSIGVPGDLLSEEMTYKIKYALAMNLSGMAGLLVAPPGLAAAFSVELGPEAVLVWASGKWSDVDPAETQKYFAVARQLMLVFSVLL